MNLHDLKPVAGAVKRGKRVGRGQGSGGHAAVHSRGADLGEVFPEYDVTSCHM